MGASEGKEGGKRELNPNLMYQQMILENEKCRSSNIGIIFINMMIKERRKPKILKLEVEE